MKVKQRKGMTVTINELRKLADELEKELKETNKKLGSDIDLDQKWSINIINYSEASDTWVFEQSKN